MNGRTNGLEGFAGKEGIPIGSPETSMSLSRESEDGNISCVKRIIRSRGRKNVFMTFGHFQTAEKMKDVCSR